MLTPAAILAMLLTVGPPPGASQHSRIEVAPYEYRLETRSEGLQRYRTIARAIAVHESSLRRDIHSCALLGDQGQSYGPTQIKYGANSSIGRRLCGVGYAPTLRAFRDSAKRAGRRCSDADCLSAFIRYSGLPLLVIEQEPRYARAIIARGKTFAATASPRPLPRYATIDE